MTSLIINSALLFHTTNLYNILQSSWKI